jgi:glycosyltransferase involved in cell wall biosynthesis
MTRPERALFVCTQMEAGGVQVLATSMAEAIRQDGGDAAVLFLYRKRAVLESDAVVSLYPCKPSGLAYVLILLRLVAFVRRYKPTAIVGMAHYSSPLACLAGLLCGVRHRIATQTSPPASVNRPARALDRICGFLGVYTANVAASRTIESDLRHLPSAYTRRLVTIYNGVRVTPSSDSKDDIRSGFGLPRDAFLLVTCGRLAPVKNHGLLLEVLARTDVHLAIAGDGELREWLVEEIEARGLQDRVTLVGEIAPSSVGRFLAAGDLFVFPSKYEAFGMAAAEAMQAGLPVLASDYPAIAEVVGDAGILADHRDVDAWVREIECLRSDATRLRQLAEDCKVRGREFSFDKMLSGFRSLMCDGTLVGRS